MDFVAVDLGASGSRFVTDAGQITVVPNNMVFLDADEVSRVNSDTPDIESNLEIQITKESGPDCEYFNSRVLMGLLAEKYSSVNVKPNSMTFKAKQRVNYISTIVCCALAKIKFNVADTFDLYMDVPPIQVENAEQMFCTKLIGTYLVKFPKYMGGTEVRFTINDGIDIEKESFMALTSFFFNMNGTVREEAKKYIPCLLLSLDIGASTCDLGITKNGKPMEKSGFTIQVGGNIVRDEIIKYVMQVFGYEISAEDADKVVAEGRIQSGMKYKDFSEYVVKAKKKLATRIVDSLPSYFNELKMPISTIHGIVVSGGGSMQSQYINEDGEVIKTAEPLSYYVTEALKEYSPDTEVVAYGDSARFANIKGLYIKAKVDQIKKAQASQSAPVVAPAPAPAVAPTPVVAEAPAVAPAVTPTV